MQTTCPYCQQEMTVETAGQTVLCPYCDQEVSIPKRTRAIVKQARPESVATSKPSRRVREVEVDDDEEAERPVRSSRRKTQNGNTKKILLFAGIAGLTALIAIGAGTAWFFDVLPMGGGSVPSGWVRVNDTLMVGALPPGGQQKKYKDAASRKAYDAEMLKQGITQHNYWFRAPAAGMKVNNHDYQMRAIECRGQTFGNSPDELKKAGQIADMLLAMILNPMFQTITSQEEITIAGGKGLVIWSQSASEEEKNREWEKKTGMKVGFGKKSDKEWDEWEKEDDERLKRMAASMPPEARKAFEDGQKRLKDLKSQADNQEWGPNNYSVHLLFAKGDRVYVLKIMSYDKPILKEEAHAFFDAFRPR